MRRPFMRALLLTAFCVAVAFFTNGAPAADFGARGAVVVAPSVKLLPFPRKGRSEAVWASDACWSGCQSYCTWDEAVCLEHDAQGHCLKFTDHCDRICQRQCRMRGGPLVPDIFDF